MTTHDAIEHPRKRSGLFGLFWPFLLLLVALGGWTWWWFQVAHGVEQGIDKSAASLRQAGYKISWKQRSVSGWPFRTFVRFQDFRVSAPSGHAFFAPKLDAEANTY